jgi:hypothetical protein
MHLQVYDSKAFIRQGGSVLISLTLMTSVRPLYGALAVQRAFAAPIIKRWSLFV